MAQMDTNDERLMEHTEKVVADMLKYVLAPNERRTEDSVEFVIIDETGVATANAANGMEATNERPFVFNAPGMKISTPATDNAFNEVLNDIEMFLSQGLDKIRAEYPMYAESTNPYLCNNCLSNAMPPTGAYSLLSTAQNPLHNNWFAGNNAVGAFASNFGNAYPPHNVPRTQTCIGELWNDEDEWPVVGNLPKRNKRVANEPIAELENDVNEEEESSEEEETNEATNAATSPTVQAHTQNENIAGTNNQYAEYSAAAPVPPTTTTAANAFQLSQTALHQTHSTTTTTTAFGVVHQQTSSSTTTNFVSNNLANAALSTTPAALYTQAMLAQQYWSSILKDAQQRHISAPAQPPIMQNNNNNNSNNNNNNANNNIHSNINVAIYERFAYAHLLQQQIIQQQQQAAIAALLQQQKIAIQNNIAAAAVAQATNTNLFAQAANVIGSSCANAFANFSLASNDYGRNTTSSTPMAAAAVNMNMHINSNLFADVTKNDVSSYNTNNHNNNSNSNSNNHRNSNNCTPTNSNISLDSLNLNVADHDERQVACPGIIAKVSQSSHD